MEVLNGMFLGAIIGVIIAIPAVISEFTRRGKDLPILMNVHACWGRKCTPEEIFVLSLFVHMLLSIVFGGLYMFLEMMGWGFNNFEIWSLFEYALYFWLVLGVVILPIVNLGFFGRREGKWVPLELLVSQFLFAFGIWLLLKLFPIFLS